MNRRDEKRGLLSAVNDFVRWLVFIVLATAALAAGGVFLVQQRLDEAIRRHIEAKFQAHYKGLEVVVESARRVAGQGIEVRNLSIRHPQRSSPDGPLLSIDELLVRCDTDLVQLVTDRAAPQQLVVRRMRLRLRRLEDGRWNAASLLPLPKFSDRPPPILVEGATIELAGDGPAAGREVELHDVNLVVTPARPPSARSASATASTTWRSWRGHFHSNVFDSAELDGIVDLDSGCWSARGSVEGLQTSPELFRTLPQEWAAKLEVLAALRGRTQLQFAAGTDEGGETPLRFSLSGSFLGRVEDARLPQPLTDVRIAFNGDQRMLRIPEATARAGDTRLRVAGSFTPGPSAACWQLRARAQQLLLDRRLASALPPEWRCLWDQFAPMGSVDAELELGFDGRNWRRNLIVDCHDISFTHSKFPYRLDNATGRIRLENDVLELVDFQAAASGRKLQLEARLDNLGPDCTGWVQFSLDEPVPLDERLVAALPDRSQEIVRSLNPHGMLTVWGRFERPSVQPLVEHKRLEIGLRDCSLNYDKFRYPLYRIQGTLSMTDDQWSFRNLEGYNDSGWVVCNGGWAPEPRGGTLLTLNFNATDVPLEDELRNALQPNMQRLWNSLRPRGTIDQLQVGVRYESATNNLSLDVAAAKRPPEQNVEGRSITIKPVWVPYQWDQVVGSLRYRDGAIEWENLRARHGDMRIELSGSARPDPATGQWRIQLSPVNVDHVDTSHELSVTLPLPLGEAMMRLKPSGLISLSGSLELLGEPNGQLPPRASWALDVDLEDGGLDCGLRLEHLRGGLVLRGQFDGQSVSSRGELNIDSLMHKGIQLTDIRGPIYFQDGQLWLGETIPDSCVDGLPRPVSAAVWAGGLALNASVELGQPTQFDVAATLSAADLAMLSREATPSKHNITGKAFASVQLSGSSMGYHTYRGTGSVKLRDADIYELPLIIALLKPPLSLKPPDATAFTSSDIDFRIEGDRVYFDRLDFHGDAISLDGRGEMNFERRIQLTFSSIVGRDDYYTSLLRPLLKEAGRRLMLIQVTGTLDEPKVRRELVPELNETLQQVFPASPARQPRPTTGTPGLGSTLPRIMPR